MYSYIKINSLMDCELKLDGNFLASINAGSLSPLAIKLKNDKSYTLNIIPIVEEENDFISLPYSVKLNLKNNLKNFNSYLNVEAFPNNNYILTIKPRLLLNSKDVSVLNSKLVTLGSKKYYVNIYKGALANLTVSTGGLNIFSYNLGENILSSEYLLDEGSKALLINSELKNDKKLLTVLKFNENECQLIKNEKTNLIEFENDSIKVLTNLFDGTRQGLVSIYHVENNEFKLKEKYTVYLDEEEEENIFINNKLAPIMFFNIVKSSNIKKARKYLSNSLNNNLSDENILSYLEPFNKIAYKNFFNIEDTKYFLMPINKNNIAKKLVVNFYNNKIDNLNII